jgi:hypothetical protein
MPVRVDDSASVAQHQACIETKGESYVTAALDVSRPAETRGRVLVAAVEHLAALSRTIVGNATQGTQSSMTQGGISRSTKLGSVVAGGIDGNVPVASLLQAADLSAQALVLPVLEKVLCLLAGFEALRCKGVASDDDCGDEDDEDDGEDEDGDGGSDSGSGDGIDQDSDVDCVPDLKRKKKHPDRPRSKGKKKMRGIFSQARKRTVSTDGTGQGYVDEYVTRLSSPSGPQTQTSRRGSDDVFVATIAREAPLSKFAVVTVMENLLTRLRTCDVFELPAFIYQLLLLVSARGNATAKRSVLRTVVVHFADLEEKAVATALEASHTQQAGMDDIIQPKVTTNVLRQIQSTTLLHIDFAVKQDPGLVAELLKLGRVPADSPHSIVAPFGIAVLLALSRTPSIQLNVLNTIRDSVVRFDKEIALRRENAFAARVCKSDTEPIRDPRAALRRAVESTAKDGWDLVCEPVLHLSFLLIDKCAKVWSAASSISTNSHETEAELGADILIELFLAHTSQRSEIVDQLVSRIVLREKSSTLAIHVLHRLARRSPSDLLQCSGKIKESIADLVSLPPWTSCSLITAYKPLLRVRPDLRDYLFLALRKALFHREPCARAVASTGFITVVVASDEANDAFGSSALTQALPSSVDVLEDAVQPLRRALSYPPAIRALLYKDMRRSAKSMRPGPQRTVVCKAFMGLLQPQLLRYVDASTSPFLLLDHCVNESGGGHLVEPLGDLIACFAEVHNTIDPAAFSTGSVIHLAKSISTVSVRDFDISKTVRATERSGVRDCEAVDDEECARIAADTANRNRARILGSVVEALLHSALLASDAVHDSSFYTSVIFPLLQTREDVLTVLKELGALSASDALRDLGGNVDIEPGAGRSIGWFGGNGKGVKSTGKVKTAKGGGKGGEGKNSKKAETADGDDRQGPGAGGASDLGQRFGAFGILVSSSSCPLVSLDVAVSCLASMLPKVRPARSSEALVDVNDASNSSTSRAVSSWFAMHRADRNVERLSVYLRAVAKAHVDTAIEESKQSCSPPSTNLISELESLTKSLCVLVHVAMSDFQQHRAQTGLAHTKAAVRSLEAVETCIAAVSHVYQADPAVTNRLCESLLGSSAAASARRRSADVAFGNSALNTAIICAIEGLQQTVDSLVEDELLREAEVVVRILLALRALYRDAEFAAERTGGAWPLVDVCADMASWAQKALSCRQAKEGKDIDTLSPGESGCTKGLVLIATGQRETEAGLSTALGLAKRAHAVLGDVLIEGVHREDQDAMYAGPHAFLVSQNVFCAIETMLDVVSTAFDDAEWCLGRMLSLEAAALASRVSLNGSSEAASPRKLTPAAGMDYERLELLERRVIRAEDRSNRRLTKALEILLELLRSSIARPGLQERLFKSASRCYKVLSIAVHAQAKRRTDPRTSFLEMILLGKRLTPTIWDYAVLLNSNSDGGAKAGKAAASMAAKEARIIPQLVYEIERFEKLLIAAQKRTKVDLLSELLRNQARDMKIDEVEDAENASDGGDENGATGRPLSVGGLLQGRSR